MVSSVPVEQPWQWRSCGPRLLGGLEAVTVGTTVAGVATMGFEQLFNQARSLHPVELPNSLPETLLSEGFGVLFVETVILDDLEDERFLLLRARPGFGLGVVTTIAVAVRVVAVGVAVASVGGMSVAAILAAAIAGAVAVGRSMGREKSRLLDVAVDTALQQGVKAGRFRFDLFDVREFDPNGDAELVGAVAG